MVRTACVLLAVCAACFPVVTGAQDVSFPARLGVDVHGFIDMRGGIRAQNDPNERDVSLGETRLQTEINRMGDSATIQIRTDFLYDEIPDDFDLSLEDGTGPIDLREANLVASPFGFMDVKLGRQILTWGMGDLLFINDLFPKDWQSFFAGRDEEYLKAPSDAVFVSLFPRFGSIDLVYAPRFDADRYISGERISYWNQTVGGRAGRNAVIDAEKPEDWLEDDEVAIRIAANAGGYELAVYGYRGYWKSPSGMDPTRTNAFFPRLSVYGASVRGLAGKGVLSLEAGYYDSTEDKAGDDPFVANSEVRLLTGYQRELARNLTGSVQYYLEHMRHHAGYLRGLPGSENNGEGRTPRDSARDKDRHVTTLRLTKQVLNQNMSLSLFAYYSPSDEDAYLRPTVRYKVTDNWLVTAGGNVFAGKEEHTFFGQFEENTNVYAGMRYSF